MLNILYKVKHITIRGNLKTSPLTGGLGGILLVIGILGGLFSCSSTSNLEDGEQLYTGLKKIDYNNYESGEHQVMTQEEVEAALATAPNGAFFGSSYHRTIPYGLWIWNACNGSKNVVKKWMCNSFGKAPVLMSNVNPLLRSSVASNVLQNHGYFHGDVTYDILEGKPKTTRSDTSLIPRTAKIQYHVNFGKLYTIDSVSYSNYPDSILPMVADGNTLLHKGDAFDVSTLDSERTRIYNLLRNHGYYYFKPSYTSFLADTINVPGKVHVQLHLADSLSSDAMRKWVIGSTTVKVRRTMREELTDSVQRRYLTIWHGGEEPPLRPKVVLRDMKMRPGDVFSQDAYQESLNNMSSKGIFSSADITFTPRYKNDTLVTVPDTIGSTKGGESRAGAGVLDMTVNAILDKPYDFTFQATAKGKTNNRYGPGVSFGLNKRNAFGGGELLSLTLGASYEFQVGGGTDLGNSYDFSLGVGLTLPRLWLPNFMTKNWHRHWYTTPSTVLNASGEIIRRAGFFTRNVLSGDLSYIFQPSATSIHEFSPIGITYGRTYDKTSAYVKKEEKNAYTMVTMADDMILRMKYKYSYSSPQSFRNPVYWEAIITEAGNIYNLISMAMNNCSWNTKGRTLFKTEFEQFVKFETDFRKTWSLGEKSSALIHFNAGIMRALGNSNMAPFSEMFFIGGANDLRGFSMRSIGPGAFHISDSKTAYAYHNGDLKFVMNFEYRPHLFGSLYGACFIDAGNVWWLGDDDRTASISEYIPALGNPQKVDLGVDAGFGVRYDLDFFVLRIDWGFALHAPYKTGKSGFFNMRRFKDIQCVNFAIGYPF